MIIGDTPLPEFSVVVMLDDIQVAYYDSNVKKMIYRQFKSEDEDQKYFSFLFEEEYKDMHTWQLNRTSGKCGASSSAIYSALSLVIAV